MRALLELSLVVQQIQALRKECSTRLRSFVAIARPAEEGALRNLSDEISQSAALLSTKCRNAGTRCESARSSLLEVLRGLLLVEVRTPDAIRVTRAIQAAIAGLDYVEKLIGDAQCQLMEDRDSLLEAALLHDPSSKTKAITEAVIQRAQQG